MHFRWIIWAACAATALTSLRAAEWRALFDGTLNGWTTWLGFPHESMEVPGLVRDDTGKYANPVGAGHDPLAVFTVVELDGQKVLRFSGQLFGVLTTEESFSNYHLRLEFKWGEQRWAPRAEAVRDSGLLYHVHGENGRSSRTWPASVELQIQERDCGDLYAIITQVHVRARTATTADNRTLYTYDPAGAPILFEQKRPIGNRCIKGADFEKPTGEWNTIELICLGDDSIHIVNGQVAMRLTGARQQTGDNWSPLTAGRIALQTEGAEVFFRTVEIRPITAVPVEFAETTP